MSDIIALYDPREEPFGLVLHKLGDWQVIKSDLAEENSILITPEPDVVVCTMLTYLPTLRGLYPEHIPLVYIGPLNPSLSAPYTQYATTHKQSLDSIVEVIQQALDAHKQYAMQ